MEHDSHYGGVCVGVVGGGVNIDDVGTASASAGGWMLISQPTPMGVTKRAISITTTPQSPIGRESHGVMNFRLATESQTHFREMWVTSFS